VIAEIPIWLARAVVGVPGLPLSLAGRRWRKKRRRRQWRRSAKLSSSCPSPGPAEGRPEDRLRWVPMNADRARLSPTMFMDSGMRAAYAALGRNDVDM
jgi:hypothetical protein